MSEFTSVVGMDHQWGQIFIPHVKFGILSVIWGIFEVSECCSSLI